MKKKKPQKKKKEPQEKERERISVKYRCRLCGGRKRQKIPIEYCITLLGLKAQRCHKCKKWGTYLATAEIDGKKRRWAIIDISFNLTTGKEIILNESTNNDNKIKKKIYGNKYKPKELIDIRPFYGINNTKNHGISKECVVDDKMQPIVPKWSKSFQKKYWKIFKKFEEKTAVFS